MPESFVGQLALPLLPDYSVRVSRRAKRMQLHVSPEGRIEVIVPERQAMGSIAGFVEENRIWLAHALDQAQKQRKTTKQKLPFSIRLAAIGERWQIRYRHGSRVRFVETAGSGQQLEIFSCTHKDSIAALQQWVAHRAKKMLVPWLRQASQQHGLPFGRAMVRNQKSCWGSCSSNKTISINRSLVFIPEKVVRYLFVHELCHTVYQNHSTQYWKLVSEIEPNYKRLDARLREATKLVPFWATR